MKQCLDSEVQMTSQAGHRVSGSNFSTRRRNVYPRGFLMWPGSEFHVMKKSVLEAMNRAKIAFMNVSSGISMKLTRLKFGLTWKNE